MNVYALIILAALLADFMLNLVADALNLRAAWQALPVEFRDVFDQAAYRRSQEYLRTTTRFTWIESTTGLTIFLLFWFAGGFNILDQQITAWTANTWMDRTVIRGLLFVGLLLLARGILHIPFDLYSTFVIEERFGFNKTTRATFVSDRLKVVVLALLLGMPLFACILAFFEHAGDAAWLWCWGVTAGFTLLIQFVAPRWIMPLFNKFTPLAEGELKERILEYAAAVDFPLQGVYVMDGSKRSTKSNAFFTGFGRHKRIALFDTLIAKHSVPELVAVLAHEIGHYKKKHILQGMLLSIAHMGVLFFLLSVFLWHDGLFEAFYMERTPIHAGFVFFGMLYSPIELILGILLQMVMRRNEYAADRFAARTTGLGDALISGLKKLARDNLANLTPHPLYVVLHYSHPPMLRRIHAIRGLRASADGGGADA